MSWIRYKGPKRQIEPDWNSLPARPQSHILPYLYEWERRCRGYDLGSGPTRLEPPFIPYGASLATAPDDPAFPPGSLGAGGARTFVPVRLPAQQKVAAPACLSFLSTLSGVTSPLSFEIIGTATEIVYQLSTGPFEAEDVVSQFKMHFPLAEVEVGGDRLPVYLAPFKDRPVGYQVVDFGLYRPVYVPCRHFPAFALDPLSRLLGALSQLAPGDVAGLQVLFAPARCDWAESIGRLAAEYDAAGNPSHESGPHKQARTKLATTLFAAVVRVFAVSTQGDARAFSLCQRVGGALSVLTEPGLNHLVALDNRGYDDEAHFLGVLERTSHRSGMLLSAGELVGLVHPPTEKVEVQKLLRTGEGERSLPPHLAKAAGAVLGLYRYQGHDQPVVWPDRFRTRHAYVLGATRMGKSTLLLNMMAQDIRAGKGLCVIDPHGDLAQDVLALIPKSRAADTIFVDLSDTEFPVAMGLLEAHSEWERRLLASDVLSVFKRLFAASWGDRLEHILRHALLTLLSEPGHTLRDIRPLLADPAYREQVLAGVADPDLLAFWRSEFAGYIASTFSPIYNKLGLLLSSPTVRNIVAQPQSRLDLARVIAEQKVLIVNLASSLIGEDNAHFLGATLVSKIQIAAMQGLRQDRDSRTPFTLYVDEFQHFVVSSFEKILSEAGKVGLSLVMANQFLEQLNSPLQAAILGNVGTMVSFRVSSESARFLEKEFAKLFPAEDLTDLGRGQAIVRVGQARDSFRIHTLPPPKTASVSVAQEVIDGTRRLYCRPRAEIEAELAAESVAIVDVGEATRGLGQEAQDEPGLQHQPGLQPGGASRPTPRSARQPSPGASHLTEPEVFGYVPEEADDAGDAETTGKAPDLEPGASP